ncbi:thiosulfate sulfurtransferase 16, chloroplastic-like isoform X1 [Miscanthus floridulus]|uniref:thiosulfate sulfurtransferase 16, chloroplastic-like isoform X1 n=1 Tax=Miscanthus floridulus TaxID=154761 RepID=UPI0034574C6C
MASAVTSSEKEQAIPTIDADQAHALLSSGHGYVDVRYACTIYTEASMILRSAANELTGTKWVFSRMREDFDKAHAPGARNVPYYLSVTPQGTEKNPHFVEEVAAFCGKDDVFVVACNTGNRSRFATADLLNAGFKNVRNLQGGYRSFLQSANQQRPQQQ